MKHFKIKSSTTKADIKKQYRLLAQLHHPDKGGNHEDFLQLQSEYEKAVEQISKPRKKKRRFKPYSTAELKWMLREFEKISKRYNRKKRNQQRRKGKI